MSKLIDLTGRRFGRLVVAGRRSRIGAYRIFWDCVCDCGEVTFVDGALLRQGRTLSCGCLKSDRQAARKRTHGLHGTPEYRVWSQIKQSSKQSGFEMHEPWLRSFSDFIRDVGSRPTPRHRLTRKCKSLGFVPGNCTWATYDETARQRNTHDCRTCVHTYTPKES